MNAAPGTIRDSIIRYLLALGHDASLAEIADAVERELGEVAPSSVRSYINLNSPQFFERTCRGRYRLANGHLVPNGNATSTSFPLVRIGNSTLYNADCFEWLTSADPASIHAVITDPPYGLVEYSPAQQEKLRNGRGGVWRIPPSFDGHRRSPLPRFTTLRKADLDDLYSFFYTLGVLLFRVTVPGANIVVASNPLLAHLVGSAMGATGLEHRGAIIRLVMTMRGGDRPKNAHSEFQNVSVMPRSMYEPWIVLRKPLEGRVQDNLRKWGTGGFRRPSADRPFGDVIKSNPTPAAERRIAPHPSLKPQSFLRPLVRAALPMAAGTILDPFAGSGSTLAAANFLEYTSIGLEIDKNYFLIAERTVAKLAEIEVHSL